MPRGDRSGPQGMGPTTGRGLGYCTGHGAPGYVTAPGPGMGMAWGYGGGRGRGGAGQGMAWGRNRGYGPAYGGGFGRAYGPYGVGPYATAPVSEETRKAYLKDEMAAMEERMNFLQREMDAMDKQGEE